MSDAPHPPVAAAARARSARTRRPPGEPRRVGYLYLLPALVVFAAFVLVPLGRASGCRSTSGTGVTAGTWVGLDNYAELVSDEALRSAFLHALVLLVFYAVLPVAHRAAARRRWSRARGCAGWRSSARSSSCRR